MRLTEDKVPVLFCTYNRLEYTRRTLPVLLERTPGGKIYVYDDGSMDGTRAWLNSFVDRASDDRLTVVFRARNQGLAEAMNWFLDETQGAEWIAKVDNDTLVPERWLEDLLAAAKGVEYDAVQAYHLAKFQRYSSWGQIEQERGTLQVGVGKILPYDHVGGSGVVIRRAAIKDRIPENGKIFGWGVYQREHPELKTGFFSGVWVHLLDMEEFNLHRKDVDMDYYLETGRKLLVMPDKDGRLRFVRKGRQQWQWMFQS